MTIHQSRPYELGLKVLNDSQRQMGQELPNQYDYERHYEYEINYDRQEDWIENMNINRLEVILDTTK